MNHRIYSKGFTLIELLVVISIIGLLSSVVLASVRVARDKGEIAAGQKFSGYNYRTLNANAVVSYNFNDTTSTVTDLSGNGYNLNLAVAGCGSTPFCRSAMSPTNSGTSLLVDGTISTYGATSGNVSLSGASGVTISAWIYPTAVDATNGEPVIIIGSATNPSLALGISPGSFLFSKIVTTSFTSSAPITLNKWQHISASFTGSKIRIYVNGRAAGELTASDALPTTGALGVGIGVTTGSVVTYFNGNIDDVAVYKEALSASEVFKLYAQGAKEHNLASNN